jgi:hypothetical protein
VHATTEPELSGEPLELRAFSSGTVADDHETHVRVEAGGRSKEEVVPLLHRLDPRDEADQRLRPDSPLAPHTGPRLRIRTKGLGVEAVRDG